MTDASSPQPVLARRLVGAFCLTLVLCLAGTAIGIRSLQRVDAATQQAIGHSVVNERLVADAYRLQATNAARYKAFALSSEPEVGELLMADIAATRTAYHRLLQQLRQRLAGQADAERLALVLRHGEAFEAAVQALVAARDSGLTERIRQVFAQRFEPAMQLLMASLDQLATLQRQAIDATGQDIAALSASAHQALLAFGLAALLLGALLAWWLVRSISGPIRQAGQTAQRVASLDLREDIAGHGRDEAGRMLQSLASMQGALRGLVGQVRDAAQAVRTGGGRDLSGQPRPVRAHGHGGLQPAADCGFAGAHHRPAAARGKAFAGCPGARTPGRGAGGRGQRRLCPGGADHGRHRGPRARCPTWSA